MKPTASSGSDASSAFRIYTEAHDRTLGHPLRTATSRYADPPARCAPRLVLVQPTPITHTLSGEAEMAFLEVLGSDVTPGDTIEMSYGRRERAVCELLELLDALDLGALHARLRMHAPADPVSAVFWRLVPARRARILTHLAGCHRRAASPCEQQHA